MTIKAAEAMTVISAPIRQDTSDKLGQLATMMQTSKSALIRWAIEEYLIKRLSV